MPTIRTVTVKPSGGDYTSLAAAIAGEKVLYPDLVASDIQLNIVCYAMTDTTAVNISGYTTDATRYISISVPDTDRHKGIYDASKYRLDVAANYTSVLSIAVPNVRLFGLQVAGRGAWNTAAITYSLTAGVPSANIIDSVLIYANESASSGYGYGITGVIGQTVIRNSIIYGVGNANFIQGYDATSTSTLLFENCTFLNTATSLSYGQLVACGYYGNTWKNCYVGSTQGLATFSSNTQYSRVFQNTASSDGLYGSIQVPASTATFTNVTPGSIDVHLAANSVLRGTGVDLSAEFTNDIDGNSYPNGSYVWNIGAFAHDTITPSMLGLDYGFLGQPFVQMAATSATVQPDYSITNLADALVQYDQSKTSTADLYVQSFSDKSNLTSAIVQADTSVANLASAQVAVTGDVAISNTADVLVSVANVDKTVTGSINVQTDASVWNLVSALVQADYSKNVTSDTQVSNDHSLTATGSVTVQTDTVKTNSVDALVQYDQSKTSTADLYVQALYDRSNTASATVQIDQNVTHTASAQVAVAGDSSVTNTADTVVSVANVDKTTTVAAVVQNDTSLTLTASANVLADIFLTHAASAQVAVQGDVDVVHTANAVVSVANVDKTFTASATVQTDKSVTHVASAQVAVAGDVSLVHTANAVVSVFDVDKTHTVAATVQTTTDKVVTASVIVQTEQAKTVTADTQVSNDHSSTLSASANVQVEQGESHTASGVVKTDNTLSHLTSANVLVDSSNSLTTNAFVEITTDKQIAASTTVQTTTEKSLTASANVLSDFSLNVSTSANVQQELVVSNSADLFVTTVTEHSNEADAFVILEIACNNLADAVVLVETGTWCIADIWVDAPPPKKHKVYTMEVEETRELIYDIKATNLSDVLCAANSIKPNSATLPKGVTLKVGPIVTDAKLVYVSDGRGNMTDIELEHSFVTNGSIYQASGVFAGYTVTIRQRRIYLYKVLATPEYLRVIVNGFVLGQRTTSSIEKIYGPEHSGSRIVSIRDPQGKEVVLG